MCAKQFILNKSTKKCTFREEEMMIKNFLPKRSLAIIELSKYMLEKKVGDRVDSIRYFEEKYGRARGTLQNALNYLKEIEAIVLVGTGRNGTYIQDINYKKLFECTGVQQIIGAMPLPYSKTYEGLATGLYEAGSQHELPIHLAYMRGSKGRIQLLLNGGCDFIILSELAARTAIKNGLPLSIVHLFEERSYMQRPHVLLLADKNKMQLESGMRLGYDLESLDLEMLTGELAKSVEVEFVKMMYNQLVKAIDERTIDAAIWNADEIIEKKYDIHYVDLPKHVGVKTTRAAMVVLNGNGMSHVLSKYDVDLIMKIQKEVIDGSCLPVY